MSCGQPRHSRVRTSDPPLVSVFKAWNRNTSLLQTVRSGYQKMGPFSAKVGWWLLKLMYLKYEQSRRRLKTGLVIVVTGGSNGVGFEIVRVLCLHLPKIDSSEQHTVIFTSTTQENGMVGRSCPA